MGLTYLLDTSVLCQPIKDVPSAAVLERWSSAGDAAVATSAVCIAEILQGLEERGSEKYWRRYRDLLGNHYHVLPFDERTAGVFAKVAAYMRKRGQPKPVMDLLIAATAKHHGLIIATLNVRHFTGLPGIQVEDWAIEIG